MVIMKVYALEMCRAVYLLFALMFAAVSAGQCAARDAASLLLAKRRPRSSKSYRLRGASKNKAKNKEAVKAEAPRVRRLAPGRWRPEAAEALENVLNDYGEGTADYDPGDPPAVVISWDDVAVTNRIGDAIFYKLVTDAEFKFNDDFWELIPLHFGRLKIKAGYNEFHSRPRSVWEKNAFYRMYRKEFFRCRRSVCGEYGGKDCALWTARLLKGFTENELRLYVRDVMDAELKRPVGIEKIGTAREDPDPVEIPVGLRLIPEMSDLFAKLKEKGFDVWVFGSSNQWAVEEMALEYGVHRSRSVGLRTKVVNGQLSSIPLLPITVGPGKAEAAAMFIGRAPVLIIGGPDDDELLSYGRGTRVRVVSAQNILPGFDGARPAGASPGRVRAIEQPQFSPMRAPQSRKQEL